MPTTNSTNLSHNAQLRAPDAGVEAADAQRTSSVLIVDDHESVRTALAYSLEELGDVSVHAVSSRGAPLYRYLEACAARPADLAVIDLELRGANSVALAKLLRRHCPDIKLLFVTANPDSWMAIEARETGAPLIAKPWKLRHLLAVAEALLGRGPAEPYAMLTPPSSGTYGPEAGWSACGNRQLAQYSRLAPARAALASRHDFRQTGDRQA